MSLLKESQDISGSSQHASDQLDFQKHRRSLQIPTTADDRGNGVNNNHDQYKMDVKTNGIDKVAEDDPLTGHRTWNDVERAKEPRWSQKFASTNFFMVIFLLAYVLQGKNADI